MIQNQINTPVIIRANPEMALQIYEVVCRTIKEIYTKYYSDEAVGFFLALHSKENILRDISEGKVCAVTLGQDIVGTGTLDKDHIGRVFVLPQFQGQGIGTLIMERFESEIIKDHGAAWLDSSLPGGNFTAAGDILPRNTGNIPLRIIKCWHMRSCARKISP